MISENEGFSLDSTVSAFLQIRKALGLSRSQFGLELGIDADTIGKWENSKVNVALTIAQIKRLDIYLKELGLSWQDLPDHVGNPAIAPPAYKRIRKKIK
ncbi:helix-turn-helix domain-containing protein [Tolypothrix sp. PCC 7601]|uniref:helix-turn-helix domain-containing protein n=1 Tax=Tolypothrix sp. PCC 7601 TaxID=1188 RepID=UPI0021DF9BF5|nr:helix-turn-helix transcriptional regulator [Tolypothrix sp. PCC 7601]UYD38988.1 helix-turn-helix transcriptional regulator [Tolypothrix sp. PCC 7601]